MGIDEVIADAGVAKATLYAHFPSKDDLVVAFLERREQRWTLVATIVASSMTFIDATVVNVALPALQADLHATITDVQWVIEAYALFLGALILVGGSLGDQFGRKRVFLFGVLFFTAASIICGIATSAQALVVGRALQGISRFRAWENRS